MTASAASSRSPAAGVEQIARMVEQFDLQRHLPEAWWRTTGKVVGADRHLDAVEQTSYRLAREVVLATRRTARFIARCCGSSTRSGCHHHLVVVVHPVVMEQRAARRLDQADRS